MYVSSTVTEGRTCFWRFGLEESEIGETRSFFKHTVAAARMGSLASSELLCKTSVFRNF